MEARTPRVGLPLRMRHRSPQHCEDDVVQTALVQSAEPWSDKSWADVRYAHPVIGRNRGGGVRMMELAGLLLGGMQRATRHPILGN